MILLGNLCTKDSRAHGSDGDSPQDLAMAGVKGILHTLLGRSLWSTANHD